MSTPTRPGMHLHFSQPELDQVIRHGKWNDFGLECFSKGNQYILLPPSMIQEGAKPIGEYHFVLPKGVEFSTTVLNPVPDSLVNLINGLGKGNSTMRSGTAHIPQTILEGLEPLNPKPQHFSFPKWTEERVDKKKEALLRRLQFQHGAVNAQFQDVVDLVAGIAEQASGTFMEQAIEAGGQLAKKRRNNLKKKRFFFLLGDGRWVVRFDDEFYPICLPGAPYNGKPEAVTEQELTDCGFYKPRNNSSKPMFIEREALQVLVFFERRNKKTGERQHSKGGWFFVNTNERIPENQVYRF